MNAITGRKIRRSTRNTIVTMNCILYMQSQQRLAKALGICVCAFTYVSRRNSCLD